VLDCPQHRAAGMYEALVLLLWALPIYARRCFTSSDDVSRGSWVTPAGHGLPYRASCPFLRPWESCEHDDVERARRIGTREFAPDSRCELRPTQTLAAKLLATFAGRTIAFIGDSVNIQQFVALVCALHAANASTVRTSTLDWLAPEAVRKRCRGVEKCHYEKGCIRFASGMHLCTCPVMGLVPILFKKCARHPWKLGRGDVVVYGSIGLHYTGEKLVDDLRTLSPKAKAAQLRTHALAEPGLLLETFGYSRQGSCFRRGANSPAVIWRDAQPQHFAPAGGHYSEPSGPHYIYNHDRREACPRKELGEMQAHHVWNNLSLPAVECSEVRVLRTWHASAGSWDAHLEWGDCTHWCLPGVPDLWNELLINLLFSSPTHSARSEAGPLGVPERGAATHSRPVDPSAPASAASFALHDSRPAASLARTSRRRQEDLTEAPVPGILHGRVHRGRLRVGVVYWGLGRNVSHMVRPNHERHIYSPLRQQGAEVTIALHTWRTLNATTFVWDAPVTTPDPATIIRAFQPNVSAIDLQDDFLATRDTEEYMQNLDVVDFTFPFSRKLYAKRTILNDVCALESLRRSFRLIKFQQLDFVVFCRPDLQLTRRIPMISDQSIPPGHVMLFNVVPNVRQHPVHLGHHGGYEDLIAVVRIEDAVAYAERIDHLPAYLKTTRRPYLAEHYLHYELSRHHIKPLYHDNSAQLLRP